MCISSLSDEQRVLLVAAACVAAHQVQSFVDEPQERRFRIVRWINIDLFVTPPTELARAQRLLDRWPTLNDIRLGMAGISIVLFIFWMRTVIAA